MVKIVEFKSNLDYIPSNTDKKSLKSEKYLETIVKRFSYLKKDIERFEKHIETNNLHDLDIKPEEISTFLIIPQNWLIYITNTLVYTKDKTFKLEDELDKTIRNKLFGFISQIIEIIILNLSKFNITSRNKYQKKYIEDISNKIVDSVLIIKTDLLELWNFLIKKSKDIKEIYRIIKEIHIRMNGTNEYFKSLMNINIRKKKPTKLKQLLTELQLNQASNRLEMAEDAFNGKYWDKAVADMRLVLEMTVTHIVRCITEKPNWKAPLKDGIEILLQRGIILDEITANHFKVKDIGVHGLLSIKGHHADGTTDDNLASSELEARYFMSLTENVIEYLLTSFRESEFYEGEESES